MSTEHECLNKIESEYQGYYDGLGIKELTYIKGRIIEQINWYNLSAIKYKRYFSIFNTLSIFLTCILPCLTTLNVKNYWIALISTLSVIITTFINAFDFRNRWIEYRMCCEVLKSNLHQYLTSTGIYTAMQEVDQFNLLVQLSEGYMKKELKSWNMVNHPKGETMHSDNNS